MTQLERDRRAARLREQEQTASGREVIRIQTEIAKIRGELGFINAELHKKKYHSPEQLRIFRNRKKDLLKEKKELEIKIDLLIG